MPRGSVCAGVIEEISRQKTHFTSTEYPLICRSRPRAVRATPIGYRFRTGPKRPLGWCGRGV